MKKKFIAFLMSVTMISGSLALPVYAENEEVSVEFSNDEEMCGDLKTEELEDQGKTDIFVETDASDEDTEDFSDQLVTEDFSVEIETVGASATIGGNINWGSSNSILPTDVAVANQDNILLGIKGRYITDMQNALNRINEIRKEACDEGIKDPRNESRNLTSSDYVPIKWSSDLEYIARIRAAEASILLEHKRLNGNRCFAINSPNGIRSYGEVLAWNNTRKFLPGIEQWYGEKEDWVGNTGKVTGHYTQMINPNNTYVGLATFINPNARYSTTTAGQYTSQKNLDESFGPAIDNCVQTVEVKVENVAANMGEFKNSLAASESVQAEFNLTSYGRKVEPLDEVNWTSSAPNTVAVNDTGMVTGVHEGTADITATYETFIATKTIQVTGHPNVELKNAKEATCSKEGYTGDKICKDCEKIVETGKVILKKEHSWDSGKITKEATCENAGEKTYTCEICEKTRIEEIKALGHKVVTDPAVAATCETQGKTEGSHCSVCGTVIKAQTKIAKKAHTWGTWKTTTPATVFTPKKQKRTCTQCNDAYETRFSGEKLKKTISVTQSSLTMQMKQKTTAFRVTFANGDSVKSWTSSNTRIVKVSGKSNGTCTITAQNRTGSATITITLKSGLQKSIKVNVQKGTIAASSLKLPSTKVEVKKGKTLTLKPIVTPITSQSKVTYSTSNKSVATVSASGVIKGVKKGTAKITVKAGTKKVVCKVIVK